MRDAVRTAPPISFTHNARVTVIDGRAQANEDGSPVEPPKQRFGFC